MGYRKKNKVGTGGALVESETLCWLVRGGVLYKNYRNQLVPKCTNLLKWAVCMENLDKVD